jgi:hypothetical protein
LAEVLTIRQGWSDEEWDGLLERTPEATIFHTRLWARMILASFPSLRDLSTWYETPSGPMLLPLFAWQRAGGLISTLHSSFPFLYGGPIPAREAGGIERTLELLSRRRHGLASLRWTGNPFAPSAPDPATPPAARAEQPSGLLLREDTTHLLRLPAGEDGFWDKVLTTAKRNDVRRLGKKGVLVEECRDAGGVASIYQLYLDSFARWGGRPGIIYPPEYSQTRVRLGGKAARLMVARHEGRILGGTFLLHWNRKVHYLAGYFDPEARALRPNVLIQVESILQAIRDGCEMYDFLPSGGHTSVETFKESFGGVRTLFPVYERVGWLHRVLGSLHKRGG